MNKEDFYSSGKQFLEEIFAEIEALEKRLPIFWVDHICFRTETMNEYEVLKSKFSNWANILIESEVNGRNITTFALHEPFQIAQEIIYLVELPAPKLNKPTKSGFEHIEAVVGESLEYLAEEYKHLNLDFGGMKKTFNQELEIKLEVGAIKFHNLSLESVITLEKNGITFDPTQNSEISNRLFAVEEKLLNVGRDPLKNKIRDLDKQGLDLEHAFSKALGFEGDSQKNLLSLEAFSMKQLSDKFGKLWS